MGADRNPPPLEVDRNPLRARVDGRPPPARAGRPQPPGKVESHPLPARAVDRPPRMEVGPQQPQEVLPTVPQGREGASDWYNMYMHEMQGRISEPPVPPYLVGMVEARWEAIGQIYDWVEGKEPPSHNITSRALWAYYTRVDRQTLDTWACQILCMIAEYHMACMTRGSPVTSPIVPRGLEECLLPLAGYAPPEDQSGTTDVWVRDHRDRTLRVAVLCHRLDMALSKEPASSGSLVRSQHPLGNLLAYFLGPGTAWELQFEDVVTQVLKENQRHVKAKRAKAATSLEK